MLLFYFYKENFKFWPEPWTNPFGKMQCFRFLKKVFLLSRKKIYFGFLKSMVFFNLKRLFFDGEYR